MKYYLSAIALLCISVGFAAALDMPEPPFGESIIERMKEHHTIHLSVSGCVTGEYVRAIEILDSSELLDKIQVAYASLLPDGEKPEFTVQSVTNGHYYYVNKDQERSDIYEIQRKVGKESDGFKGVFYAQGERSFGMFESLITLRVSPAHSVDNRLLNYDADIHVYPHCMALRFFLKYFPGVKRYFRSKTNEMQGIITGIFNYMIDENNQSVGAERLSQKSPRQGGKYCSQGC